MTKPAQQLFPDPQNPASNMVLGQLLTNDIQDKRILQAMRDLPRSLFMPETLQGAAYVDEDIEIAPGRWLTAPLTLARLLDLAAIKPNNRVLVIGCLTGYASAVAAKLAAQVVATELDDAMLQQAREHMKRLGIPHTDLKQVSSLAGGYALGSPYDVVIVAGALRAVPPALVSQLAIGGRLVAVRNILTRADSGQLGPGKCLLAERVGSSLQHREFADAAAALLPGFDDAAVFRL